MQWITMLLKISFFVTAILLMTCRGALSQDVPTPLTFDEVPLSELDVYRTLQSAKKVSGTEGLYLITHYGDREELFRRENQKAIEHPFINDRSRFCTVFSSTTENCVAVGRNWDNENVGAIIINLYRSSSGYASISFSRSIDLGFGKYIELDQITSTEVGRRLLLAPFYCMDGINEYGLTVTVTGLKNQEVTPDQERPSIFITYLIRKLLDETRTVEEAVTLVDQYIPFDLDQNSLNGHLFVVDATGISVILEYTENQWQKIYTNNCWQVLSTKPVYHVPDSLLRKQCWRHKSVSEALENARGKVDWKAGMNILQGVEQKGTTWSVMYLPVNRELYFNVYKQWENIYHLSIPWSGKSFSTVGK
jgi:hypothetical protein